MSTAMLDRDKSTPIHSHPACVSLLQAAGAPIPPQDVIHLQHIYPRTRSPASIAPMAKHNGNANASKHIKPSPLASALHVGISLRLLQGLPARVNRKQCEHPSYYRYSAWSTRFRECRTDNGAVQWGRGCIDVATYMCRPADASREEVRLFFISVVGAHYARPARDSGYARGGDTCGLQCSSVRTIR
jgi:hypothetical protein